MAKKTYVSVQEHTKMQIVVDVFKDFCDEFNFIILDAGTYGFIFSNGYNEDRHEFNEFTLHQTAKALYDDLMDLLIFERICQATDDRELSKEEDYELFTAHSEKRFDLLTAEQKKILDTEIDCIKNKCGM